MTGIGEFGQKNQSEIHLGQNFSFLIFQERLVPPHKDINHLLIKTFQTKIVLPVLPEKICCLNPNAKENVLYEY